MRVNAKGMPVKGSANIRRWLGAILLLGVVGFVVLITIWRRQGRALELMIARVPVGVSVAEADRLLGGPPDDAWQDTGVLVNGVMLLDASNADAKKYGPIASYEFRRWKRGDVFGIVLIGDDSKVAGHLSVHQSLSRRLGLYGWWKSLP